MNGKVKSEAEQLAFFELTRERYLAARAAAGAIDLDFRIAGSVVRLGFAGPSLLPHLSRAFAHLRVDRVDVPDLTLGLWDSSSTGVEMPPPPCDRDSFTDRGDIWGFESRRIKTAFQYYDYSVNVMDLETATGVYWVKTAEHLPYWVDASPLRTLLHWWMERRDCQLLHAAAVGTDEGAVLITGRGGVGKSSTALACLGAGMRYVADDYLVVRGGPRPAVHSLYATAKLEREDLARFPQLAPHVDNPEPTPGDKAVLFLHPHFAERIAREMPLRAILVPAVDPGREATGFTPVDPRFVRQAAAFTTMSQLPYVGRHTHEFFDDLCSALPGYRIDLGSDRRAIAPAIADLIHDPDAPARRAPARATRVIAAQRPLVSVVIPVYNGAKFVRDAVANVLAQGYPALEIIIVDDGSTDDTAQAVQDLPCDVRYFRQDNSGAAAARNRGIRDTAGELIAFLDVDDLWPENVLERLVDEAVADPRLDVVRGYAQLVEKDAATGALEYRGSPTESFPDYIGAALYRKRVFGKVGLFDPGLLFGEDVDWFNRARELEIPIKRLDAVTLFVRRHGDNMTEGKSLVELNMLRVFKKALDRKRGLKHEVPQ